MNKTLILSTAVLTAALAAALVQAQGRGAPAGQPTAAAGRGARAAGEPAHKRTAEIGWRLSPSDQTYASIDGAHLKQYVEELTAMSRRYRDRGHQFWGRITGTEADAENAQWMLAKFKQIGLSDVREQTLDLPPQWMPQSWSVVASGGGKTLNVDTAQPTYLAVGTTGEGLDLEAVWVGMGSDADIALSHDVKGKAAFFYSTDTSSRHQPISGNAIKRLGDRGAAAIFVVLGIAGNEKTQFYPVNSPVPTFSVGQSDGLAVRDLIASNAQPIHVKVKLDVQRVPNLKSAMIWGTLPGVTDESVVVVAHRDGWFEGANDNAAGMATMVGIAEYFAKMPKEQRKRTIYFVGTNGHHDNGAESGAWFASHPEFFAKTAVLLNAEHTGAVETVGGSTRLTNAMGASTWYATGPKLGDIVINALDAFGVATYPEPAATPAGEIGRYYQLAPSMQVMSTGYVWHSDQETAETISANGLAAVTRAYAKVIADSNNVPLVELRGSRPAQ
jgi:hypothetical protein